jgi:hypothetical protein
MAKRFISLTTAGGCPELLNIDQIARVWSSEFEDDGNAMVLLKGKGEAVEYDILASKLMKELDS